MMEPLKRRLSGHHAPTNVGGAFDQQDFFAFAGQKRPRHQSIDATANNQVVDLPQNLRPRRQRQGSDRTAGASLYFQRRNDQYGAFGGQFVQIGQ